jgi:translocation and assembly module TamB
MRRALLIAKRVALRVCIWGGALLVTLLLISILVMRTAWFANFVREKVISVAEESTGGKVEIGSFGFEWWGLHAHIASFVLHGTEPAGQAPLFHASTIDLRLKRLAGLKKTVDLEYLGVDRASANVIVFPDGSTNVPQPKVVKKANKSGLETVVDLAIHKFELTNSSLEFAQQNIPLAAHGQDLRAQLLYRTIPSGYHGDLHFGQLQVAQGKNAPLTASLDAPVEIGKDSVDIKNLRLATKDSQIVMNASLSNFAASNGNALEIGVHAIAHVSLAEVQRTSGVAMSPCAKATPCFADADVEIRAAGGVLQDAKLKINAGQSVIETSGDPSQKLAISGKIAIGEIARLFDVASAPEITASVTGDARYRAGEFAVTSTVAALGGELSSRATYQDSQLQVNGQLRNLEVRELTRMLVPNRVAQSYDGNLGGAISATANFKAKGTSGVRAHADLKVSPGRRGSPVSGEIHASYNGAGESVDFEKSYLALAHSRADFSGTLGKQLAVDVVSTNSDDFLPMLAMTMSSPPAKMPASLAGGKLEAHARIEGALANPQIGGAVAATKFVVGPRSFDRLNANFSASRSNVSLSDGTLARQSLLARFSGSVGLRAWAASDASPLQVSADLQNGDIADALALAGRSDIPAKGALTASAQINGTIGNPLGSIRLTAANGVAYDQPFDRAEASVDLADQLIKLTALNVTYKNARVEATGTYSHARDSLMNGNANVKIASSGVDLATIPALLKQRPGLVGTLQLNATAAAAIRDVAGNMQVTLSSLDSDIRANGLQDSSQAYGDLTAHVGTAGSQVNFRVDSNLTGAAIHASGSMTLPTTDVARLSDAALKDFPFNAEVAIQNASIESALALASQDLPLKGAFGLTGHFSGTLADPNGSAQVNLAKATIYGEPVDSLQADVRVTTQLVEIQNLRASSPAGSIHGSGTFKHPRDQFDRGDVEAKVDTAGLRMNRIHALHDFDAGIDGTIKFAMDAAVELDANRDITIKKVDGNAGATSVSYNGKAFGDATITAQTRGASVALQANSNFAGSTIHGTGEAQLTRDLPLTATLTVTNLRYSNLRGYFSSDSIRPDFEALLEANASINGPAMKPASLAGKVEVSRLELTTKPAGATAPSIALKNDGVISADFSQSAIHIQKAHITGRSTEISITGGAQFSGANPLNLAIKANTDLNLLEQIDRNIHASGAIAIDTIVRGTPGQPLFNGTATLKNASINIEPIPNGLSNANGTIALRGETASITNFTAESGGGKLTLAGFAARNGSTIRYTLRATASHVRTRYQGVTVVNSANLTIGGTTERGVINGTVTVERAGFNPQSDVGSLLTEITRGSGPSATGVSTSSMMSSTRLDIRIHTAPDARFQTTFAETIEAQADLNLTGTLEQPGMVGRVVISQGDIVFFGNQYTVERGVIAFYNPLAIEPQLNIGIATTVRNINVTLNVSGPMDNLKLSYVSDPPLQFDEIVGLLATGKRPSSDPGIVASQAPAPQQSVSEMGASAVVSQAVASPLSSRLQRVFGVSQLRIDPTFAGGSALPNARLSLQQRVSNSVTFTYSQDLSQSNSELIRVEWALSPKFSAVATRDENGIFGVDFFYKRQFR